MPRNALFLLRLLVVSAALAATLNGQAQRMRQTLNDGWRFRLGDETEAHVPDCDDSSWQPVHLPHTWNTDAYAVKSYYRGTGWYRRTLRLPETWRQRRIVLRTEAASKALTLYVDGREAGRHAGGYTAFSCDLTPWLEAGSDTHTLALRVDNAREDIPPISGDFTFFGGIYRDVWIEALPPCRFAEDDFGGGGLFVTTPQVSEERATVALRAELTNDGTAPASVEFTCTLHAPDGTLLQTMRRLVQLREGGSAELRCESRPVEHPQLWTPETPALYRLECTLRDARSGELLDRAERVAAFRWFRFDGREGFFLNGKPYKLRGVCRHQDQRPYGVALTGEMHRRDFRLMKQMGANFLRISHYPQDEALLELCDREGMLAWEEIPVIDIVPETEGYGEHCERNLREMIRQHYNHPSVILWGYMNEILLVAQRRHPTPETLQPVVERTLTLARRLEQVLHEEDSTRLSTMAFHGSDDYNATGLSAITDVVGWNLYAGWYGGNLHEFEAFLARQQRDWPDHPVIVSEYGAGSDRRLHAREPQPFDFSIEYQQRYAEHYLPVLENTPYVCGGTYWNLIDFSSALRDESMPRINNKGLLYADRTPKDLYYYFQAAWRSDVPMLYIASRDWTERHIVRSGAATPGQPVKIYTNLPEAELFIDGRSVGKQPAVNHQVCFEVPLSDGWHLLEARGEHAGRPVQDALRIRCTSVPERSADWDMGTAELAVNVGSGCSFTSEQSGLTWLPDRPYAAGGWGYLGGEAKSSQTEIALTADGPLFQSFRKGLSGYRFDLPEGRYEVELLLADCSGAGEQAAYLLGRNRGETAVQGDRFAVRINGTTVESDCFPLRDNGAFCAVRKRYPVRNETGAIVVEFAPVQGSPILSGIKIRKL